MRKIIYSISAIGLMALAACGGDGNSNNNGTIDISGKTKQEVFMLHSWALTSWIDSGQGEKTESIETCKKDDTYDFTSTTSFKVTNNTKCDPSDNTEDILSWGMTSANASSVVIFSQNWDIAKMTGEKITLTRKYLFNFPSGSTDTMYSTMIFEKK